MTLIRKVGYTEPVRRGRKRYGSDKSTVAKRPGREVPVELVDRNCLQCGRRFIAKGRFQRLCRIHRKGDQSDEDMPG